jgi:anaerobic magnesium-protoporphyrin IX monomethyl ester cyclase
MSHTSKILFTHSYFLKLDPKQLRNAQPYAPLGTLYAAAVMREEGYDVSLHDVQFTDGPDEVIPALNQKQPGYFIIYDDGFNYLTKMCLTNMRNAAFKMIALAKERGCVIIVSSSDSTDHYEQYLDAGADFVLMGEAELTLVELIKSLGKQNDPSTIAGISFKKNECYIKTPKRSIIKDLDCLPLPAWDMIDMEPYKKTWLKHAGFFSINIGTTRGCPFKCNWCAKPIYGNRYNARSPQNVVNEIKYLKQTFGIDHVWFCDDIFGLKPGWVNEFAHLVEKENLNFKFKIQSRADLLVQERYVEALARAGCDNVWMGAESGSQKILDAMDKGITILQIEEATRLLKKHSIKPSFFIQFGYLGETIEDIKLTIRMINRLMPHDIGISVSYPLPGTGFYEKVREQLKEKSNWTHSDELALMFHNTYQPLFYKQLHRYVHKNFRKKLATDNLLFILKHPLKTSWPVLKKVITGIYIFPSLIFAGIKLRRLQKA